VQVDQGRQKIMQYLADAHAKELTQITTLRAHLSITEPGDYRNELQAHLRETQTHAERVQRRLSELGFQRNAIQMGFGLLQTVIGQGIVMAKGPVDMLRGLDVKEKMLRNARDEMTTEALEIASYDAIERMANNIGDETTAELAADIRADEEAMLENLRSEIPLLTDAVVRAQVDSPGGRAIVLDADELPIANYASLNADEIVSKLRDLSQDDLRKIQAYEGRNQNRKTILERIDALEERERWPGYDGQTVDEITTALDRASEGVVAQVRDYERAHKNRSSVIKAAVFSRSS
ncbi:MAG: ferritin-like domain-containing protein, partial [Actinomycetota bacterium]|nr:ferritin-like domain-containing protein [Actinomycetota bacterium]